MTSNPDWQDPNRDVSPSQIIQRTFDNPDDAWRVNVVAGSISIDPGEINIGAVELKDQNSDNRVDVEIIGSFNAVITRDAIDFQKTKVNVFGSALVTPGSTLTLVSYVVPVSSVFTFSGGIVGGDESGEFTFEIAASTIALVRNSGSNRTIMLRFLEPPSAGAATLLQIKVKNIGIKPKQFEATLSGYTMPA